MILLVNDGAGSFNQVIRILLVSMEKAENLTKLYDNCHRLWSLHFCQLS
jgi:2'-5' RNA ligase